MLHTTMQYEKEWPTDYLAWSSHPVLALSKTILGHHIFVLAINSTSTNDVSSSESSFNLLTFIKKRLRNQMKFFY